MLVTPASAVVCEILTFLRASQVLPPDPVRGGSLADRGRHHLSTRHEHFAGRAAQLLEEGDCYGAATLHRLAGRAACQGASYRSRSLPGLTPGDFSQGIQRAEARELLALIAAKDERYAAMALSVYEARYHHPFATPHAPELQAHIDFLRESSPEALLSSGLGQDPFTTADRPLFWTWLIPEIAYLVFNPKGVVGLQVGYLRVTGAEALDIIRDHLGEKVVVDEQGLLTQLHGWSLPTDVFTGSSTNVEIDNLAEIPTAVDYFSKIFVSGSLGLGSLCFALSKDQLDDLLRSYPHLARLDEGKTGPLERMVPTLKQATSLQVAFSLQDPLTRGLTDSMSLHRIGNQFSVVYASQFSDGYRTTYPPRASLRQSR